jgi:hypothetical protein
MNIRDENVGSRVGIPMIGVKSNLQRTVVYGKQPLSARAPLTNISNQVPAKQAPIEHKNVVVKSTIGTERSTVNAEINNSKMEMSPDNKPTRYRNIPESPKVDEEHANDPQHVTEFVHDIVAHYKNIETKYMANPKYVHFTFLLTFIVTWRNKPTLQL